MNKKMLSTVKHPALYKLQKRPFWGFLANSLGILASVLNKEPFFVKWNFCKNFFVNFLHCPDHQLRNLFQHSVHTFVRSSAIAYWEFLIECLRLKVENLRCTWSWCGFEYGLCTYFTVLTGEQFLELLDGLEYLFTSFFTSAPWKLLGRSPELVRPLVLLTRRTLFRRGFCSSFVDLYQGLKSGRPH